MSVSMSNRQAYCHFSDINNIGSYSGGNYPRMLRPTLTAAVIVTSAIAAPIHAEIVASTCRLLRYDGSAVDVESFKCDFRQSAGNVQVWSDRWTFEFPAAEQDVSYLRINSQPLIFTRTGQYTLEVYQGGN